MSFSQISNEAKKAIDDAPSKKKQFYPINPALRGYLKHHAREVKLPVSYD